MPVGEDEPVAVGPVGDRRVDLEETAPQGHCDLGHAHRHPGMPAVGLLHGVHGQRLDRVDRQFLDPVFRHRPREATGAGRERLTGPAHLAGLETGRSGSGGRGEVDHVPLARRPDHMTGGMAVHPGGRIALNPDMVLGELDETCRLHSLMREELPLVVGPTERVLAEMAVGAHHPVARDDERDRVACHGRSHRPGRSRLLGLPGQPAIGPDLTPRDRGGDVENPALERESGT